MASHFSNANEIYVNLNVNLVHFSSLTFMSELWLIFLGEKSSWIWVNVAHIFEVMNVSERGSRKMWTFLSLDLYDILFGKLQYTRKH